MINTILQRLQNVKTKSNNQWIACCPAHNDKNPSLAIKRSDNGTILMKCWSGCTVDDICTSIGIEVNELFENDKPNYTKTERDYFNAETVLMTIVTEANIVAIASRYLMQKKPLTEDQQARLFLATARINDAVAHTKVKLKGQ